MKQHKLLLIVNPAAGRTKSRAPLFDALTRFSEAGYLLSIHNTVSQGDATRITLQEGPDYDVIVAAGGDGTLNEVISGLMQLEHPPLLGYLPQGSTNDFASNISGKVVGAVGKFAGAIGLAVGGLEGFKRIMDSTQTSGDLLRGTMHSMKVSVEEFFYSVNRGNLSTFISNLGTIATRAKEAYGALDQLGNTQISYGVLSAKNQASIAEAQYLAKNKFAPTSERMGAFGMWGAAIQSEEANIKALQRELVNAAVTAV
jgi:hypothetical protein